MEHTHGTSSFPASIFIYLFLWVTSDKQFPMDRFPHLADWDNSVNLIVLLCCVNKRSLSSGWHCESIISVSCTLHSLIQQMSVLYLVYSGSGSARIRVMRDERRQVPTVSQVQESCHSVAISTARNGESFLDMAWWRLRPGGKSLSFKKGLPSFKLINYIIYLYNILINYKMSLIYPFFCALLSSFCS
jgi:hypothetical protein